MEDESVIHLTIVLLLLLFGKDHQGSALTYGSEQLCPGKSVELNCPINSVIHDVKYSLIAITGTCGQSNSLSLEYKPGCIGNNMCMVNHTNLALSQFKTRTWSLSIHYSCLRGNGQGRGQHGNFGGRVKRETEYEEKTTCFYDLNTDCKRNEYISIDSVSIQDGKAVCVTEKNGVNSCDNVVVDEVLKAGDCKKRCFTINKSSNTYEYFIVQTAVNISFSCTDGDISLPTDTTVQSTSKSNDDISITSDSIVQITTQLTGVNKYSADKRNTGAIVGISLGIIGGLLTFIIIVLLFSWRRDRSKQNRERQSHTNSNTGQQGTTMHAIQDSQNDTGLIVRTNTSPYTEINTVNPVPANKYDYIDIEEPISLRLDEKTTLDGATPYMILDPAETGFDRKMSSTNENERDQSDVPATTGSLTNKGYSVLDLNQTGLSRSPDPDKMRTMDTPYAILDPAETGFDRSTEGTDRQDEATAATQNIYSHSVDNAYDSANHLRKDTDDKTYDHFSGAKTKDNYDVTQTTYK